MRIKLMAFLAALTLLLGISVLVTPRSAAAYTARCSLVSQTWHIGEKPVPYTLANIYVTGRTCVAADGYIDNYHSYLHFSLAKVNVSPTKWYTRGVTQYINTRAQEEWRFYGASQWCAYWICSPTELWYFNAGLLLLTRGYPPIVIRTAYIFCQNSWCGGAGTRGYLFWR